MAKWDSLKNGYQKRFLQNGLEQQFNTVMAACYCNTSVYLVEVDCLVEPLASVRRQVHQRLPLLVDVVGTLLDLRRAEVARLDEVVAGAEHVLQVPVTRRQLILVRLLVTDSQSLQPNV